MTLTKEQTDSLEEHIRKAVKEWRDEQITEGHVDNIATFDGLRWEYSIGAPPEL